MSDHKRKNIQKKGVFNEISNPVNKLFPFITQSQLDDMNYPMKKNSFLKTILTAIVILDSDESLDKEYGEYLKPFKKVISKALVQDPKVSSFPHFSLASIKTVGKNYQKNRDETNLCVFMNNILNTSDMEMVDTLITKDRSGCFEIIKDMKAEDFNEIYRDLYAAYEGKYEAYIKWKSNRKIKRRR